MDDLNKSFSVFIELILKVIANKKVTIDVDSINMPILMKIAKFHNVETIIEKGLNEIGFTIEEKYQKELFLQELKTTTITLEKDAIIKALDKEKIKTLPMKGIVIKDDYPFTYLRQMADIDILVPKEDIIRVRPIMQGLGYKVVNTLGNHDSYHKLPFMNVEIHRQMIDESYSMAKYYHDIWSKASLVNMNSNSESKAFSYEYKLNSNDFYIFLIAHYAKHFSTAGTGIKVLIDNYVFLDKHSEELDFNYINTEFKKLNILKFANSINELTKDLFDQNELSDKESSLLDYILHSGSYGTITSYMAKDNSDGSVEKSKIKIFFNSAFPSYKTMKRRNPILEKLPFLLPVFWFTRLIKGIFNGNARKRTRIIKNLQISDLEKVSKIKEQTGFKENNNEN